MLGTGLWDGSEWLRRAGLLGIALVIAKVFLSDMAELEGVLRALSFLGLGAALVGLGATPTAASTQRQGRSHKTALHEALWRHSLNEAPHSGWNGVAHVGNSRPSLGNPATGAAEQLVALKFLLHFVGDLHQPLHAAADHDAGGNKKLVAGEGVHRGNLHHYWDVEFVERLGTDPSRVSKCADYPSQNPIMAFCNADTSAYPRAAAAPFSPP